MTTKAPERSEELESLETQESPPEKKAEQNRVAELLVEEGILTSERLEYAARIRDKLPTPRPSLVRVLQDLRCVEASDIDRVLRAHGAELELTQVLLELQLANKNGLATTLDQVEGDRSPKRLFPLLIRNKVVKESDLLQTAAALMDVVYVRPDQLDPSERLMALRAPKWFIEKECIPLEDDEGVITVAMTQPRDEARVKEVRRVFGAECRLGLATRQSIFELLDAPSDPGSGDLVKGHAENEVVHLVNTMFDDALARGVSDIHVEPLKDVLRVRFRQDGSLVQYRTFPAELHQPMTSRIKILAGADIAEKRRHQDGRILLETDAGQIDVRASFYVTIHGEKSVLRLLNNRSVLLDIHEIGMAPRLVDRYIDEVLSAPSGVVIITGPTGSGKTTTLYGSLNHLNDPTRSIVTAEDPVEYVVDGISQCSINAKANVSFESTLKTIVRQDPDVIIIGEIRDAFSADTAIQAALTGHKVLTTFHTEDSIGGLVRLLNMNIEAFLISSTVVSVMAQRLLRRVCDKCHTSRPATAGDARRLQYDPEALEGYTLKEARGCEHCHYTGYKGRIAAFEMLVLNERVKDAILQRATSYEIRKIATETTGLVTLVEDAIIKAVQGHTTIDEVRRQTPRLSKPRPIPEIARLQGVKL